MPPNPRTPSHPRAAPQPRATTADRSPKSPRRALPEARTASHHPRSPPPHHRVPPRPHAATSIIRRTHFTNESLAGTAPHSLGDVTTPQGRSLNRPSGRARGGKGRPGPGVHTWRLTHARPGRRAAPGSAPALEGRPAPARSGAGASPPGGPARDHPAAAPPGAPGAPTAPGCPPGPAAGRPPRAGPAAAGRPAGGPQSTLPQRLAAEHLLHRPRPHNTPPCPHAATAITCRTHFTNEPKIEFVSSSPGYLTTPSAPARALLPSPSRPSRACYASNARIEGAAPAAGPRHPHRRLAPPPQPAPRPPQPTCGPRFGPSPRRPSSTGAFWCGSVATWWPCAWPSSSGATRRPRRADRAGMPTWPCGGPTSASWTSSCRPPRRRIPTSPPAAPGCRAPPAPAPSRRRHAPLPIATPLTFRTHFINESL